MAGTIKLVTVVTDPNGKFWRGWACHEADLTLVPNELGAKQLVDWGVSADKIKVVGMPVHPDFSKAPLTSRNEFLESLRLHPGKLTVCVNAGWAGGGNMLDIYRQLAQVDKDIQVIFLCGHNDRLYEKMRREALKYDVPTAVLPFHDRMADLMSAVDLMVTKAGGLTTFESLAKKLPLAFDLITMPMPQEIGTVELLVQQNLAYEIHKPSDIVKIVMDLKPVVNRDEVVLPAVHQIDKIFASEEIARWILSYCDQSYAPHSDALDSSQGATECSNI
jgi:UDP-N-acetylglucosamine:LPS N-acetylglucosamine transferase